MGEDMNGYQPPVVEGLDGDDSSGVSTYGTEWVWETYYVTYVNGAVAGDTVIITPIGYLDVWVKQDIDINFIAKILIIVVVWSISTLSLSYIIFKRRDLK